MKQRQISNSKKKYQSLLLCLCFFIGTDAYSQTKSGAISFITNSLRACRHLNDPIGDVKVKENFLAFTTSSSTSNVNRTVAIDLANTDWYPGSPMKVACTMPGCIRMFLGKPPNHVLSLDNNTYISCDEYGLESPFSIRLINAINFYQTTLEKSKSEF